MSDLSTFSGGIPGGLPNPDSKIVWDAENPNQIVGTFIIDERLHKKLQGVLKNIIRDYKKSKKGNGIEGGADLNEDQVESTVLKCGSADALSMEKKLLQSRIEIEATIQKIKSLQEFSNVSYDEVIENLKKCDESNVLIDNVKIVHGSIKEEIENQINVLENLLNKVIKPSDKEVKEYLKTNKDFETLVDVLLPYEIDTSEASDKLGVAFTSINKIKLISEKVRKALKEVNMTIDSYASNVNLPEFNKEYLALIKKNSDNIDLSKIVAAMTILKTNFKDRKDIKDYLKKGKAGGVALTVANSNQLGRVQSKTSKTTLAKNIKKSQNTIAEIYKLFLGEFNSRFNEIKVSIDSMSDNINEALSYDENFLLFIDAYQELDQSSNDKNLFSALIGVDVEISSTQVKDHFMTTISHLVSIVETIENSNKVSSLTSIKNSLKSVLELIDTFTDLIKSSKSVNLIGGDKTIGEMYGGDDVSVGEMYGGALFDKTINVNDFTPSTRSVADTVGKFKFLGNVLKIKRNLSKLGNFYTENKKEYNELLGKTIGYKISQIYEFHQGVHQSISDKTANGIGSLIETYNTMVDGAIAANPAFNDVTKIDPELLKDMTDLHYEAREGLYKAMEAIDLYLLNFTQAIASDPSAIDTLDKILNSTSIISKFYNNATGNNLAQTFDLFLKETEPLPALNINTINLDNNLVLQDYYQRVNNHGRTFVYSNANIKTILEKSKEALDGFSALKNILSAFFFIGDTFNKKSTKDSIHMTPNMIFKNLQKYLWVSSFTSNMYQNNILQNAGAGNAELLEVFKFMCTNVTQNDNIFKVDDEHFVRTMKAIISKIFTVVGTYSIMNDPTNKGDLITNPSRLLIGGTSETVVVDDNLVEHYIRLPLLVEFYRNIFDKGNDEFKKGNAGAGLSEQIAYIPDINGLWSGLFSIIFDKSKNLKYGVYDAQNIKLIISEINKISKSFKGKTINDYVDSLVYEVNRRYGVIKKKDIVDYYKTIEKYKENAETLDDAAITSTTNFDTLDENADVELAAPSDKYKRSLKSLVSTITKPNISTDDYDILSQFRLNIDNELNKALANDLYKKSFRQYIKIAKNEIGNAATNEIKVDVIMRGISNSNDEQIKNNEHYVLFHELVVTPLALLFAQYQNVSNTVLDIHRLLKKLYTESQVANNNVTAQEIMNLYQSEVAYYAELDAAYDPPVDFFQDHIFTMIIEKLYNLKTINSEIVSTDLFDIKFASSGSLILDYSKYQSTVESLLENIKSNIVRFRTIIPSVILDKFEKKTNIGSIYFLQDRFVNKCLKNVQNSNSTVLERKYTNLDSLSPFLKNFKQNIPVEDLQMGGALFNTNDKFVYNLVIRSVDYNGQTETNTDSFYRDMFRKYNTQNKQWEPLAGAAVSNMTISREIDSGLLFAFNRLLPAYLSTFYDVSTKKIYQNLFTSLINNSVVNMTELGSGYNDIANVLFRDHLLPTNNITISASNSFILQTLYTRALNPAMPDNKFHSVTDLSVVSPHLIELMGTQLPLYIQLFTNIVKKAIYIRRLVIDNDIVNDNVNVNQINPADIVIDGITVKQTGWSRMQDKNDRNIAYKAILDNIISCANDVIVDATNVLKEVKNLENNKLSLFMDVKKDFIRNYKNITKNIPFTPISQISNLFNNEPVIAGAIARITIHIGEILPTKPSNINNVKFQHGLKPLFTNNKLSMETVPFINELLTKYNSSVSAANSIDKKNVSELLELFGLLTKSTISNIMKYPLTSTLYNIGNRVNALALENPPFQYTQTPTTDIINLTQDTIVEQSVKKLVAYVSNQQADQYTFKLDNRDDARILNIIDLNIVPINIHALVKEIPLVNIYNYSYSFDSFMTKFARLPEVIFVKNPYEDVGVDQARIDMMFSLLQNRSENNLQYPRFLRDQLHKKALFSFGIVPRIVMQNAADQQKRVDRSKERIDTKLIRNLMFITELQRLIRVQIRSKLETINTRVISNAKILSSEYTELNNLNDKYTDNEFTYDQ